MAKRGRSSFGQPTLIDRGGIPGPCPPPTLTAPVARSRDLLPHPEVSTVHCTATTSVPVLGFTALWSVDMSFRNQVFISYSHEDTAWRDAFVTMLVPAIERRCITLWSDANIPVGESWSKRIGEALETAVAGLLLVTPSLLKSEFVKTVELPRLLNLAMARGISIWWIPVSPSLYTETPLKDVQAAWDPKRPLEGLSKAHRNAAIQKICTQMVEDF